MGALGRHAGGLDDAADLTVTRAASRPQLPIHHAGSQTEEENQ